MAIGFVTRDHCPQCQSRQSRILCELPYSNDRMVTFLQRFYRDRLPPAELAGADFRVWCCGNCEFIYQDPILDSTGMRKLYEHWIDDAHSLRKKETAKSGLFRQYAAQVQTLQQMLPGRPDEVRVLEFGMGWGYWSRMAQAHGLDVTGYELSDTRSAHARRMGLKVIDQLPSSAARFDAIYANQVFEHLPEPLPVLRQLRELLTPDGIIYIRVPDGRGVAHKLRRQGWQAELDAIHPLEHINCFTRKTLIKMAANAGLQLRHPPLRLNWGHLYSGLKREITDRVFSTHAFFKHL